SPALSFSSIAPAICAQGATVPVTVTGINTHFAQGVTTGNFGDGVSIGSIAVTSATQATVQVAREALARPGPRTGTIVTGGEFALGTNAFTVTSSAAAPHTGNAGFGEARRQPDRHPERKWDALDPKWHQRQLGPEIGRPSLAGPAMALGYP